MKRNARKKENETQQQPQPYDSISFIAWSNVFGSLSRYARVYAEKKECKDQTHQPNRSTITRMLCENIHTNTYSYTHTYIRIQSEQMSERLRFRNTYACTEHTILQYMCIASFLLPLHSSPFQANSMIFQSAMMLLDDVMIRGF